MIVGLFMCLVKPFAGFGLYNNIANQNGYSILVKSFTQRKQEYTDGSEYDVIAVQRNLANPLLLVTLLFCFALDTLLSAVLSLGRYITAQTLNNIRFDIFMPEPIYLRSGKLTI